MLESHFSMTAVVWTEALLQTELGCEHRPGNIRDNSQVGATNLLRNVMPEIEIITPLDKIFFHVFLNISIVTLHCYLCDMSGLLEVDLKIFITYMYSTLQKCGKHSQANCHHSHTQSKFPFYFNKPS